MQTAQEWGWALSAGGQQGGLCGLQNDSGVSDLCGSAVVLGNTHSFTISSRRLHSWAAEFYTQTDYPTVLGIQGALFR